MSDVRQLQRYVHGEQYELFVRGDRDGPAGQRHDSGGGFATTGIV